MRPNILRIPKPAVSVVIGIRDWSLDRLALALRAHCSSTLGDRVEVVVSDYGSRRPAEVRKVAEKARARVVRTKRGGPWSRSRALNVGIRAASAEFIVNTDADILFAPSTLEIVFEHLWAWPKALHFIQCRDLPPDLDAKACKDLPWDMFEQNSVHRPRWGMGGLVAFHRSLCDEIHGYDERMEHHGAEDNDFGERARRAGHPINWIARDGARIYHLWHPNAFDRAREDRDLAGGIKSNRRLRYSNDGFVRNHNSWGGLAPRKPLVSVVIVTHNRAVYLRDAIRSVLAQTISSFELIVIDDGSSDGTRAAVEEFADDRIRYFYHPQLGIPASRNRGVSEARSPFLAILDDDDILLPDSLERHIDAVGPEVHGTFGAWIDFDNETGQLLPNPGHEFTYANILFKGKTLTHGGSMLRTEVLRRFPYDEAKLAGADYDLFLRMARAGLCMRHTGRVVLMRRLHVANITATSPAVQRANSGSAAHLFRSLLSDSYAAKLRALAEPAQPVDVAGLDDLDAFRQFLPAPLDIWHLQVGPFAQSALGETVLKAIDEIGEDFLESYPSNTFDPGVFLVSKKGFSFPVARRIGTQVKAHDGTGVQLLSRFEVAPLLELDSDSSDDGERVPIDLLPIPLDPDGPDGQSWLMLGPIPAHDRAVWIAQRLRTLEGWEVVRTYADSAKKPRLWIVTESLTASAKAGAIASRLEAEYDVPVYFLGAN